MMQGCWGIAVLSIAAVNEGFWIFLRCERPDGIGSGWGASSRTKNKLPLRKKGLVFLATVVTLDVIASSVTLQLWLSTSDTLITPGEHPSWA